MQATRPAAHETSARAAARPAAPAPVPAARPRGRGRLGVVLGLVLLGATVYGSAALLGTRAGTPSAADKLGEPSEPGFIVAFGHVDVPSGIANLYPTQQGLVVAIKVKENQAVKKGD